MINKVILVGHLGQNPEIKKIGSDITVANFTVATSEKFKNDAGNVVEKTEWHNIVAWRKLADICGNYLKKGSKVYLEGKLVTDKYQDKKDASITHYSTKVHIDTLKMLDGKPKDGSAAAGSKDGSAAAGSEIAPGTKADDDMPF